MGQSESFGRYQLVRLAGAGGMAQVHLARQVGPKGFVKPCVLKRISPGFLGDEAVRRMFLEEARVSALLNHPHIVQTFDYGEVDGAPYMAMELVDGVNLAQLCQTLASKERWLPLRTCVEICISVLDALEYAHNLTDLGGRDLRLVHRDVSPQNILLSRQGGVKLADFGIARHDAREEVTRGPSAKGKPGYMAPEQAMGQAIDGRADLFAVGIVLAELVSARRVMRSGTHPIGLAALPKRLSELLDLRRDAPPELKTIILDMTALEPTDRPESARHAADLLRAAALRIHGNDTLNIFLEKVFARFFPVGSDHGEASVPNTSAIASVDPEAGASERSPAGSAAISISDPDATADTQMSPLERALPAPPSSNASGLPFEGAAWRLEPEQTTGIAGVYGGWPTQYLKEDEPPALEIVPRSSSVEAMRYFGAQGSSRDPQPAEDPMPPPGETRPTTFLGNARPQPVGQGASEARRPPPGVPGLSSAPADAGPSSTRRRRLPAYVPLAGMGAGIALLGLGVLALVSNRPAVIPAERRPGSVLVRSSPAGATISIEGRPTPYVTPHEIANLPAGSTVRISVALAAHLTVPEEATALVPSSGDRTTATFTLRRGRVFRIETNPPSASVEINGKRLPEVTPLNLPVIPFGETASLAIALEGHIPSFVFLRAAADTATVTSLMLQPGKEVDIVSSPPGGMVTIDGVPRGPTPLYDLLVPLEKRFSVKIQRRGYKTWVRQHSSKTPAARLIEAELEPLPLLALPLSKEDLREARGYDERAHTLRMEARKRRATLERAERRLSIAERSPTVFIGRIAEAQAEVDDARGALAEIEAEQQELETQLEAFRQRVMAKLDGAEPDR